jgi:hypothetical protein
MDEHHFDKIIKFALEKNEKKTLISPLLYGLLKLVM